MTESEFCTHVAAYIARHGLLGGDAGPVLVAMSGGADSVALVHVLMALGYDCEVAHCNFHLRGDESDRDERFVTQLCERLGVKLHIEHMDVPACQRQRGLSVEMACRELRYEWFNRLASERGCQAIAVGHHQDDNVETFFLNALRGSGIAGLAGMRPRNGNVVRPLLCVSRADIVRFLAGVGSPYVTDSTNLANDYKRNKVRNVVMPAIEAEFPDARKTLTATVCHTRDCADLYHALIGHLRQRITTADGASELISIAELRALDTAQLPLLIFELVKERGFGFEQCVDIAKIIEQNDLRGQHFYSSTSTLTIALQFIVIEDTELVENEVVEVDLSHLNDLKVNLEVKRCDGVPFDPSMCDGKHVVAFGTELLKCHSVVLRHWRVGDRFRPFGMRGSKLLSDLFADLKLTEMERRKAWLLEADGTILWVLGYRAAAHFPVTPASTSYLLLTHS
ncbi:MAG: tRNA lysidine(34) synthetase TilS [Muribaculaceae bacterium]|nr:tRNA lysidine(34) synthetase TilS [Muribaculaceae bacterium]